MAINLNPSVAIQMKVKAVFSHRMVLFIMLYKVVLAQKSVDRTEKRDHSNKIYWAVMFTDCTRWLKLLPRRIN